MIEPNNNILVLDTLDSPTFWSNGIQRDNEKLLTIPWSTKTEAYTLKMFYVLQFFFFV